MSLNASNTATDIVNAIQSDLGVTLNADAKALWTAIIGALYTRIKADIQIQSQVASGIAVNIPSTSGPGSPSVGSTSAAGTATSNSVT